MTASILKDSEYLESLRNLGNEGFEKRMFCP